MKSEPPVSQPLPEAVPQPCVCGHAKASHSSQTPVCLFEDEIFDEGQCPCLAYRPSGVSGETAAPAPSSVSIDPSISEHVAKPPRQATVSVSDSASPAGLNVELQVAAAPATPTTAPITSDMKSLSYVINEARCVQKIIDGSRMGSNQFKREIDGKDAKRIHEFAELIEQMAPTTPMTPKCPKCGEEATYQTPDGTYWDSSAHYWRVPLSVSSPAEENGEPIKLSSSDVRVAQAFLRKKLDEAVERKTGVMLSWEDAAGLAAVLGAVASYTAASSHPAGEGAPTDGAEVEADPQAFEWRLRQMYPDPKFADTDTGFTTDAEMARFAMENARIAQEQLDRANALKAEADKLYSPSIQRTIIKLGRAVVALRYRLIASRHYTVEKLQVALSESRAERDELRGAFLKLREEVEALPHGFSCSINPCDCNVSRVLSLLDRATTKDANAS